MSFQDKIRNADCTECPLHETAEHVCLMGTGKRSAKLIIVGEAPGAREDDEHAAFVGPAGKLLDELLREVGISRKDCYITNAAKCRPGDNRTPTRAEVKACGPYLAEEIHMVRAKWILCLGNTALQAVTGRSGITKHRGKNYPVGTERVAVGTFHPAAALRSSHYLPFIKADLLGIARRLQGVDERPRTRTYLIRSRGQLDILCRKLAAAREVAFDLETTGLHEWAPDAQIVTLGVSWEPGVAAVIPINHSTVQHLAWLKVIKPYLEDPTKRYIAHNAKFDCKWLAKFGVYVPCTFDTMLAAHLLDENRPKGLKSLSQVLLDADDYDMDVKDCYNANLRKLATYNGKDCDYTLRLYHLFREQLKQQPRLLRLFKFLMMPASALLTRVEMGGIYLDPDKLHDATLEAAQKIEKLQAKMDKTLPPGKQTINYNSPAQVAVWLFNDLKLPIVERTKTDAPSTKESVLFRLQDKHKVVKHLLAYRRWAKYLSTYLGPWRERADAQSRIHPSYRLTGTVTGRLSSAEPNLQQVPRDSFIRGIIGAPEGWRLVECDYSQVELRLAAMIARERTMLSILASGEDLHTNTACAITGKQAYKIDKEDRVIWGKHPNFGLLFSMKPEKYREYCRDNGIEITEAQAKRVYKTFHETYPALRRWHDRVERLVRVQGYITSPVGRVRHLPDIKSQDYGVQLEAIRQAINSPIQSLASDLCLSSAIRLHEILPPKQARLVGSIHDALVFEIREGAVDDLVPVIVATMEDMSWVRRKFGAIIDVPILVEAKVGTHWSEGEVVDVKSRIM